MGHNIPENLIGQVFGRLTVVGPPVCAPPKRVHSLCQCECGRVILVTNNNLKKGNSTGCNQCWRLDKRKAEFSSKVLDLSQRDFQSLYEVYRKMVARCTDTTDPNYHNYGGRGIAVYPRWLECRSDFMDWVLDNGWRRGLQMDRTDNNGNYEPGNIRFVTPKVNGRNKRKHHYVEVIPGEVIPLSEAIDKYSVVDFEVVRKRIYVQGWTDEAAVLMPYYRFKNAAARKPVLREGWVNPKRKNKNPGMSTKKEDCSTPCVT